MSFQRARTKEQKDKRLKEIINVTCDLYSKLPYDKITMSSIANNLSFTRGNLYTYAATKEEIFLLVILDEQKKWVDDILNEFSHKESIEIAEFSMIWAKIYYRHKRLLSLYSLMYSIVEKNVSVDKLTHFKIEFFNISSPLYEMIPRLLNFISQENLYKFYTTQFHFLCGFYPATQDNKIQREAIEKSEIPYVTPDFEKEFTDFIAMILKSMCC